MVSRQLVLSFSCPSISKLVVICQMNWLRWPLANQLSAALENGVQMDIVDMQLQDTDDMIKSVSFFF